MIREARAAMVVMAAMLAAACGGAGGAASAKVGSGGGVVQLQSGLTLQVPAGALASEVEIRVREVEPRHGSREFELEPAGTRFALPARLRISADQRGSRIVKIEDGTERELQFENEQELEGEVSADVRELGRVAVKVDDGPHHNEDGTLACVPDCAAGLECDDGVCKAHGGDQTTTDPCDNGGYWSRHGGSTNCSSGGGGSSGSNDGHEKGG
ncbi:MAG: hypothetical protein QM765_34410 [Myxococcales bacterium]